MRILAGQTAVALQNSALFTKSVTLLTQSEARNAELLATQRELGAAPTASGVELGAPSDRSRAA